MPSSWRRARDHAQGRQSGFRFPEAWSRNAQKGGDDCRNRLPLAIASLVPVPYLNLGRADRRELLNLAVGERQFRNRSIAALGKLGKKARRAFYLLAAEFGPGLRSIRVRGKARGTEKRVPRHHPLRRIEVIDDTAQSKPVPMIGGHDAAREHAQAVQTDERTHGEIDARGIRGRYASRLRQKHDLRDGAEKRKNGDIFGDIERYPGGL